MVAVLSTLRQTTPASSKRQCGTHCNAATKVDRRRVGANARNPSAMSLETARASGATGNRHESFCNLSCEAAAQQEGLDGDARTFGPRE
jgi:hypothetical protein